MVLAWILGTFSDAGWLTSSNAATLSTTRNRSSASDAMLASAGSSGPLSSPPYTVPPPWLLPIVSLLTGLFSGILCKVKDIVDGKHDRNSHLFPLFSRWNSRDDEYDNTESDDKGAVVGRSGRGRGGGDPLSGVTRQGGIGAPHQGGEDQRYITTQRMRKKLSSSHLLSIGDRLYMVVPFCTGQWFAFILRHGWRGIVVENGTILLSLSMVGYTMLSFKYLRRQLLRVSRRSSRAMTLRRRYRHRQQALAVQARDRSEKGGPTTSSTTAGVANPPSPLCREVDEDEDDDAADMEYDNGGEEVLEVVEDAAEVTVIDIIDLISKLFTTSFGVVVLVVLGLNIFVTSLAIPFLRALSQLNALVSGVGIVIELIMYEFA